MKPLINLFPAAACLLFLAGCHTCPPCTRPHFLESRPALVWLGESESDGYRYHHFRRADGSEFIERRGKTMDL